MNQSLIEPKESLLSIKYKPDGQESPENPPRFTWLPESERDVPYRIRISKSIDFPEENTEVFTGIPYNFFTPDHIFSEGTYYWSYTREDGSYKWSRTRSFLIKKEAKETPLPKRKVRFQSASLGHPRIWLDENGLKDFQDKLSRDKSYCGFDNFYDKSVVRYDNTSMAKEPLPYKDNKREVSQWRQNYIDCQQALEYIRSLAVGGRMTQDDRLIHKSKEGLLSLAQWDANGPTSRDYNDECAFRVAYALAFGYDWLYGYLSHQEKELVGKQLFLRTRQVADHIILNSRIHYSLYDSHAVRSLSSVLTPCCIALLGEIEEAEKWLHFTIEYFSAVYTPWGGSDGGWAEGPMYWTTGMAFVIDALNTIKSFCGIDLYKRPFFQKTGDFPLYCNPVDTKRASFCDQSNLGKYPGHKTAFNIRQFAGITGNEDYQWYYDQVFKREPEIDGDFFNHGWWDFNFDDMVYRHDYGQKPLVPAQGVKSVKWFQDIGWAAINKDLKDFDNHIFLLTKSSPYGSVSHSHGDQNAILLHAYGEPLLIKSGYYVGFNTSMHKDWRRQTKSHNGILLDGMGQYAGMDKAKQLSAKGNILKVLEKPGLVYIKEEASGAYRENLPDIIEYTREIYFIKDSYFVLVDTVETGEKHSLSAYFHSLSPFEIQDNRFTVNRDKAVLRGEFVYCSSRMESLSQSDEFEGVKEEEIKGQDKQFHLAMTSQKARNHVLVTLLVPHKKQEKKLVTVIKDDQGHDVYFYFSHNGHDFSLRTDGNKRY